MRGKLQCGAVILNRVKHADFPNTIAGVIYQPGAFTAVSDGQINHPISEDSTVVKAAQDAINGWDPTNGCIYYFNPNTATNKWIWSKTIVKTIGKHHFTQISPNKTIEGCIGGLVGSILGCVLYTIALNKFSGVITINYAYAIMMGLILCVIGQFGDLAASSIKRYADVKDFSNLIPGHGGMLDRIDSIIFIAPFAYILLNIIV